MLDDHVFVDIEDVPVILEQDGREQVRRLITKGRHGFQNFSFHVVHFNAALEKDMLVGGEREVVMFPIQGSAEIEWGGRSQLLRPGVAFGVATEQPYRHKTGPLGMTVVVCVNPPSE